ncbi:MAG: LemA family protein [Bacteroidales bacterium]|nr:LemA family protein [Bacteroidales bacterium]
MTAVIVIIAIVAIVGLYFFTTQRSLVSLDEKKKNAFSQITVQLKTRWDAVTSLVEMTKQYTQHEHDTLKDVIAERRSTNVTPEQMPGQEEAITKVLSRLNFVAEQYPDLKANQMFSETMAGIKDYEEKVRLSRMVYNDSVTKLNMMVRQWPSSIVASTLGFTVQDLLPEEPAKENAPSVSDIFNK